MSAKRILDNIYDLKYLMLAKLHVEQSNNFRVVELPGG